MEKYDVAVVGAGPAGAATALACAKRGFKTVLLEKNSLKRPKVCGGLITHSCVGAIRALLGKEVPPDTFVEPGELGVYIIPPSGLKDGYYSEKKKILNVERLRFDFWLTSCALDAGVTAYDHCEFRGVENGTSGLMEISVGPRPARTIQAKYVVGSDGVYSRVRRALFSDYPNDIASVVQDYYFDGDSFDDYFYVFFRRDISPAYAYVVVKDGQAVLGLGRVQGIEPSIDDGMMRFRAWLKDEFGFAGGAFNFREGWSIPFGRVCYGQGDCILVGDAGGFCHPLTGEGILYGVRGGALVPEAMGRAAQSGLPLVEEYRPLVLEMGNLMWKFREFVSNSTAKDLDFLARQKLKALETFT